MKIGCHNNFLIKHSRPFGAILLFFILTGIFSCKKYLDKKSVLHFDIPSSLSDFQELIDNSVSNIYNADFIELVSDDIYFTNSTYNAFSLEEFRTFYVWDKDARITVSNSEWTNPYFAISNNNVILDYLPKITIDESEHAWYNNIKGGALFFRAFKYYQLAQLFCGPYSTETANDLGLVLRTVSDPDAVFNRATVQQTYDLILSDLLAAVPLLSSTSLYASRPNKVAAYGMLARVYLGMREYEKAKLYSDSALSLYNTLLDYNNLAPANLLPANFIQNPEVVFSAGGILSGIFDQTSRAVIIDTLLSATYDNNDLRKAVFFSPLGNNKYTWKGRSYYESSYFLFYGIAVDELYLIRAECEARADDKEAAMADLNTLLRKRWKMGTFTDLTASDAANALSQVLLERRKELIFRGLRWPDLRRFNLEGANITLKRIENGITYTLPPNDLRWVLLIPDLEISRSGIPQNPR